MTVTHLLFISVSRTVCKNSFHNKQPRKSPDFRGCTVKSVEKLLRQNTTF